MRHRRGTSYHRWVSLQGVRMTKTPLLKSLAAGALLATAALGAHAQDFPGSKPITIVVPFAAGGPTDRVARDLAEAMRKPLGGVSIVVDNAAGAGSTIGNA